MTILSTLRPLLCRGLVNNVKTIAPYRAMSDHGPRTFPMQPSRWQWTKFKDFIHFYVLLGVIPLSAIVFYANVFIGPATLQEIPEGYEPKHWEYNQSPITRFLARYVFYNPQQEYEKYMHVIYEEDMKRQLRKIETRVRDLIKERSDYQAYYYRPVTAKYHRRSKEIYEDMDRRSGD